MNIWWLVIIGIAIFAIVALTKGSSGSQNTQVNSETQTPGDFGQQCRDIAEQILRDAHTGCAMGGCCVYDRSENDQEDDDGDDDDDSVVCYCEHYGKYVRRHSPCEHFRDKNPRRG